MPIKFVTSDGGFVISGYPYSKHRDNCILRGLTILLNNEYRTTVKEYSNALLFTGTYGRAALEYILDKHSFVWQSRKGGYRIDDMPLNGRFLLKQAHHVCALVDGTLYDLFDSRRRHIYGFWRVV
jgi:hypothetical protein